MAFLWTIGVKYCDNCLMMLVGEVSSDNSKYILAVNVRNVIHKSSFQDNSK